MATLTYWKAPCTTDSDCYSLREKTKKAVQAKLASCEYDTNDYGTIRKVVITYTDAFDLLQQCQGEGGLWEGWDE